jgi:transcription initiation factor TFIIB
MAEEPSLDDFDNILTDVLESENAGEEEHPNKARGQYTVATDHRKEVILDQASSEMSELAAQVEIPDSAVDMGEELFEQFITQASMEGHVIEPYAAAALYCSCKVSEVPVLPEDLINPKYDLLNRTHLLRRTKTLASTVGLDPSSFFESKHYVPHYCEELNLSAHVEARAIEILKQCNDAGISSGKSPSAWAAAAIYNAALEAGDDLTQQEVSNVASTTTVTIRNRYTDQREHIRDKEIDTRDPYEFLSIVANQLNLNSNAQEMAKQLLDVDAEEQEWESSLTPQDAPPLALAAISVAGRQANNEVGYRVLKQYTTADSRAIRQYEQRLSSYVPVENVAN